MIGGIGDRSSFAGFSRSRRQRCGPVGLRYIERTAPVVGAAPVRVAYAINRRVGNAVTRNRVRRRLREALVAIERERPSSLRQGDYLFTAEAIVAELPFEELKRMVRCATERAYEHG